MSAVAIRSPLPGIFYRKPSPESAPFKNDGDAVTAEDVIGLIEVMKTFQSVQAGLAGTDIRFIAEDGDAVMAGETLAEVQP